MDTIVSITFSCDTGFQRGITSHIGVTRVLGLSSSIPFFAKQLVAWIDLDQPPTGLRPSTLLNNGYLPDEWTTFPWRLVDEYEFDWWRSPGRGAAVEMLSWKPGVQRAFSSFQ